MPFFKYNSVFPYLHECPECEAQFVSVRIAVPDVSINGKEKAIQEVIASLKDHNKNYGCEVHEEIEKLQSLIEDNGQHVKEKP